MATRAFKKMQIVAGGTPQPWVFTTLTSAIAAFAGQQSIAVADSSFFRAGDYANIDEGAGLTEHLLVNSVPDSTHIKVTGVALDHASGVYAWPSFSVNSAYLQSVAGNAGLLYVGRQGIVIATLAEVVATLVNVPVGTQPVDFSDTRTFGNNPTNSQEWWIDGTTADEYLPSFGVV